MLVVVRAVQKMKHYLMFQNLLIFTDPFILKYLNDQNGVPSQYDKCIPHSLGFNINIQYKKDKPVLWLMLLRNIE